MPKGNIVLLPSNAHVGAITFELANIYATGDFHFPSLTIPVEITLTAGVDNQLRPPAVRPISMLHIAGEFSSPQQRVIARFQQYIGLLGGHPHRASTTHTRFEIPLD